jgi:hypothetical protein
VIVIWAAKLCVVICSGSCCCKNYCYCCRRIKPGIRRRGAGILQVDNRWFLLTSWQGYRLDLFQCVPHVGAKLVHLLACSFFQLFSNGELWCIQCHEHNPFSLFFCIFPFYLINIRQLKKSSHLFLVYSSWFFFCLRWHFSWFDSQALETEAKGHKEWRPKWICFSSASADQRFCEVWQGREDNFQVLDIWPVIWETPSTARYLRKFLLNLLLLQPGVLCIIFMH